MTISIPTSQLKSKTALLRSISQKQSEIEAYTYTKVSIQDGKICFLVVNSQVWLKTEIQLSSIQVDQDLEFYVPTDTFCSLSGLIFGEETTLKVDIESTTLTISDTKTKHSMRISKDIGIDVSLPALENPVVKVNVRLAELIRVNKVSLVSVADPRATGYHNPEFLGVCYYPTTGGSLKLLSSDRYRISKSTIKAEVEILDQDYFDSQKGSFLLSTKGLEILAQLDIQDEQINMVFTKDEARIETGGYSLFINNANGKFPEVDAIIPQSFAMNLKINTKEFLESLKVISYLAKTDSANKTIQMHFDPQAGNLKIQSSSKSGESSQAEIAILSFEGQDTSWSQSFNSQYLLEYVSIINSENFIWEANPGKPALLHPEDSEGGEIYLVSGIVG